MDYKTGSSPNPSLSYAMWLPSLPPPHPAPVSTRSSGLAMQNEAPLQRLCMQLLAVWGTVEMTQARLLEGEIPEEEGTQLSLTAKAASSAPA